MGRRGDAVAVVSVFHVVSEKRIESPVKAFCGEELDRMNGDYVWADQVTVDKEYIYGKHCQECLDSDDYSLYLLGSAGEAGEPTDMWQGVFTGRMSCAKPNMSNVPKGITKQEVLRMAHAMQDNPSVTMLSPTEYAELERKLLK